MTKRDAIEMFYTDQHQQIEAKFIDIMVKKLSDSSLISEFNRKSKGSRLIQIDKYHFELDFFELTENEILKLSIQNIHYHNGRDMSRNEMRYRLLHGLDL